VPTKGFDIVIDAARLRRDIAWVIAGDGPERAALEQRAAGLGNVTFVGHLDAHALSRRLGEARAVAVPSTWPEPFGMVVLEAWRAGRPVIVSDRGALPDIVRDGVDGIVVQPGDPAALLSAAERLLEDGELADAMAAAGLQRVQREFALDAHLERLEEIYDATMAARSAA